MRPVDSASVAGDGRRFPTKMECDAYEAGRASERQRIIAKLRGLAEHERHLMSSPFPRTASRHLARGGAFDQAADLLEGDPS